MARPGGVFCRKSELKKFPAPNCAGGCGVVPFPWARCLFRGVSATLAARCCGDRIYSRGIVAGLESGSEWRTGGQIAGMKKPARGGLVFPGAGFLVCSISTRLRAQKIIGCVDQLLIIDRCGRSIFCPTQSRARICFSAGWTSCRRR